MEIEVKIDDLKDGKVIGLLREHLKEMQLYSPQESIHALNESDIRESNITFWSAWDETNLAACGALKKLDEKHGEIKSMRTARKYLRRGIAERILQFIISESRKRNYNRISLETGTNIAFVPAVNLYKKYGFTECEPFAAYKPDPHSIFLTKKLENA